MAIQEGSSGVPGISHRGGERWRSNVNEAHQKAFSAEDFPDYAAFTKVPGALLKDEPRTVIRHIFPKQAVHSYVLKLYAYSRLTRLRYWMLKSKAHREFAALENFRKLGVPAVEPIVCGSQRTGTGFVESCFLITRYVDGCVNLRDWLRERPVLTEDEKHGLAKLALELGEEIRKLHAERFYLSRLMAKNILVRTRGADRFEWLLMDQPYARFMPTAAAARWGQVHDLGALAGSFADHGLEEVFGAFYSGYLPDPLGGNEADVRRRVALGTRIYHNRTPLRRVFKVGKRRIKEAFARQDNPSKKSAGEAHKTHRFRRG